MRSLLAALLATGCYAPNPKAGSPCPDGVCPAGLVCSPASHTCELTAVDAMTDAAPPSFQYRRRITIENGATSALPSGFTIRLALATVLPSLVAQGKARSDLADVRIIGDTLGERNRIIDAAPAPVAASFSLAQLIAAGATNTEYALYYGAPMAGPPPETGSAVFPVFDQFTAGIANTWLAHDAPTTYGGELVLRAGHTDAIATTAAVDNVPLVSAIELVATIVDPTSAGTTQPEGTFFYWFGYQRTGDFSAVDPWAVWIARAPQAVGGEQKSPVGCEAGCSTNTVTQDGAPHYYSIQRDADLTRFERDTNTSFIITLTNNADYSVMLRNFMATSDLRVDWVRARARVSPDPSVTLGGEESL